MKKIRVELCNYYTFFDEVYDIEDVGFNEIIDIISIDADGFFDKDNIEVNYDDMDISEVDIKNTLLKLYPEVDTAIITEYE